VRFLETANVDFPAGQSFGYSNANYETVGLIVQTVSGQSYEEYVKQHIFAPLDMRNSLVSREEALQPGMASGYRWWFGSPVPVTLPYNRAELPAGYVISSAEDMARFLIAQGCG
jgi:CubicO group peptidase (beta-lactamase class C family)